jgi:hypothetical protein
MNRQLPEGFSALWSPSPDWTARVKPRPARSAERGKLFISYFSLAEAMSIASAKTIFFQGRKISIASLYIFFIINCRGTIGK